MQNTVAYAELGTATSGVTFFRTLGGSFGASIIGSIYANCARFPPRPGDLATAWGLTGRGEAEVGRLTAAWKAWLTGELSGWLGAHNVGPDEPLVNEAIGRITLRLVREADVEARRAGLPRATAGAAQ